MAVGANRERPACLRLHPSESTEKVLKSERRRADIAFVENPGTTIERARRGDRDALAQLWTSFQPPLLRYLRARRAAAPDDVASQVWIDVASGLHRFDGNEIDFRQWLFTIAHHRSVDEIRRSTRRPFVLGPEQETADGADEEHARQTSLDRALGLIAALPPDMAEAVMLRVVNDLPVANVADLMSTTPGNVRVLVHRGLARLRRKLAVTHEGASTMKRVS